MEASKRHCAQCGATIPLKTRVMQTDAKCPQCGTPHQPPTYWESLTDYEKACAVFLAIGIGSVAVMFGAALLLKTLSWVLDILPAR